MDSSEGDKKRAVTLYSTGHAKRCIAFDTTINSGLTNPLCLKERHIAYKLARSWTATGQDCVV
jgi:hypothetical protein